MNNFVALSTLAIGNLSQVALMTTRNSRLQQREPLKKSSRGDRKFVALVFKVINVWCLYIVFLQVKFHVVEL
jgi:hypothetical protein